MKYKQRLIFANKQHITSALYHLQRVTPKVSLTEDNVIDRDKLNEIRKQLETWERESFLSATYQNDPE